MSLIKTDSKQSLEYADVFAKGIRKNMKCRLGMSKPQHPSTMQNKAAEPDNYRNTILHAGSRLRSGPYIIYIRTAEHIFASRCFKL